MKGDYLEVLNTDRKWWKVRNKSQEVIKRNLSLITDYYHCCVISDRVCALHNPEDVDTPGPQGVPQGQSAPPSHSLTRQEAGEEVSISQETQVTSGSTTIVFF